MSRSILRKYKFVCLGFLQLIFLAFFNQKIDRYRSCHFFGWDTEYVRSSNNLQFRNLRNISLVCKKIIRVSNHMLAQRLVKLVRIQVNQRSRIFSFLSIKKSLKRNYKKKHYMNVFGKLFREAVMIKLATN